ncbi:TetR family transcriptional regulator [Virgisporangium aliadipatigenens]|uniref:TetR family transcriptional regulator n=1 Tax=Virgisporangium aliadipatigenens TaxID=741659 RepID=A0A8J3YK58_9ACTN|nr:TetR/AcrR family transcriptional regulator [Virgisporangium aliadipatigenens]GIJ46834.1 TetR family transcriptional regulator [Virgisporangium aliadipatigenens]
MGKPLRADAARNRDRLLGAAAELFAERGLDAPLDEIARRAGVSIGTLYNHFPTRDALQDALLPMRLAVLDDLAVAALDHADAWAGLVAFLDGLFALHAEDRSLNDALAGRVAVSPQLLEACHRTFGNVERLLARAKESGQLRADFAPDDFGALVQAMSQVIRTSPGAWRRHLAFFVDGLRTAG